MKYQILLVLGILVVLLVSGCTNTYGNNAVSGWSEQANIVNNDINQLNQISKNYENKQTCGDLQNYVNEYSPRLDMLSQHLQDAKTFLRENGQYLSNAAELNQNIDDEIVWANTRKNQITTAINDCNQRQQLVGNLFKVFTSLL